MVTVTHLIVVLLLLILRNNLHLLRRLSSQSLQLSSVNLVDIVLFHGDIDSDLIFVVGVGFDNSQVFADLITSLAKISAT